ncbi:MFS transporter [Paenibacillus sp. JDR-2]|uniref:MFS transporter n=1 Tax=Paenibacillus sp. (strain JDR-2) TaxID=324057 RepID=UPI0001666397|nr:MFS transporter [Paenibacillus sp. JDR-2]ACT01159.1 major facilitator superfamily MFS_1 [Paenibacillus sp. JDR-2]
MNIQPDKLWSRSFVTLTVSYLLLFLSLQMLLSPFPTYAKEQFHPNNFALSLVTSLFALAAIVTRFATAALLRKVHRNVILFVGLVIAAIATVLYPFASSMTSLLILRALFGIGFGMTSTIIPTLVSQIIPKKRTGEGIGYFGLSTSIAMSLGPMIGLSVIKQFGFTTLAMIGTIALVLIIPLLIVMRSIPKQPAKAAPPANKAESGEPASGSSTARMMVPAILNVLMSVTYGGILGFIALYGAQKHIEQIGLFFLFIVFTVFIIRPISGKLFDRRGPMPIVIPGAIVVIASLIILSYAESLPLIIVSALLYGFGFGAIQPTTQAWMLREAAPHQVSFANSLYYNTIDFGVAVGSMLLGIVASASSYSVMYRWAAVAMVLFMLVYLVSLFIERKNRAAAPAAAREKTAVTSR